MLSNRLKLTKSSILIALILKITKEGISCHLLKLISICKPGSKLLRKFKDSFLTNRVKTNLYTMIILKRVKSPQCGKWIWNNLTFWKSWSVRRQTRSRDKLISRFWSHLSSRSNSRFQFSKFKLKITKLECTKAIKKFWTISFMSF